MIIDLDDHLVDKHAKFLPPLSQTLPKPHDGVSIFTKFRELKFDHRFGCPVDIQACTPNFAVFQAIWTCFKLNSSEIHDEVSLLKIFSQLKFDHRFGCAFDRQEWTPTF